MTDVELLPDLPSSVASVVRRHGVASAELVRDAVVVQGDRLYTADQMRDYARANIAPLQAENERLRAEVAALRAELDSKWAVGVHTCGDHCQRDMCVLRRRAERLEEACERLARKWERQADEHGVRQFTGNDHRLFANELRAAMAQEDRNG